MLEMKIALKEELNKRYLEAVKHYESELNNNSTPPIEAYVNLAFLYWEFAAESTFNDANNIPKEWSEIGGEKYPDIIELGLQKHPRSVELNFWKRYFPHRHYFEEFTQKECEQIIVEYGDKESLVPYFFLYLFDEDKYREKRNELLRQCAKSPTAKNRYIMSFN
jgi:hypothetical protein